MSPQLPALIIERFASRVQQLRVGVLCCVFIFLFQQPGAGKAFGNKVLPDTTQDVYIKIKPSKTSPYKGEPFTVSYLLYYAVNITDPGNELDIKLKNCYVEEYADKGPAPDEHINNRLYHVVLLKKILVIPQTEGALKVPAVNISVKVTLPATKDDFFGNEKTTLKRISAKPLSIRVIPLPLKSDTTQFSGAVGNFSISCIFQPSNKFSNLLVAHLNIKGTGNLKFSSLSGSVLPPGIDYTELPNAEKDSLTTDGLAANYTFSFQLFANYRGKFTLPPINFIYFSPGEKKYVKYTSPACSWQVNTGQLLPKSLKPGKAHKITADPVLYTKLTLSDTSENGLFFRSGLFYFAVLFSALLFLAGILIKSVKKRREKSLSDYNFKTARWRAAKNIVRLKLVSGKLSLDQFNKQLTDILFEYLNSKDLVASGTQVTPGNFSHKFNDSIPAELKREVSLFFRDQHETRFSLYPEFKGNRKMSCVTLTKLIKNLDGCIK